MSILLTIVSIISAILLIIIILMQQSKTRGGLGAVSGGMAENMFGASATNVLTKITTWLAVIFLASTVILAAITGKRSQDSVLSTTSAVATEAAKAEAPKAVEAAKAEAPKAIEAAKAAEAPKAPEAK